MDVLELYKKDYEFHSGGVCKGSNKYDWAASQVFDLTTYDQSLDELFVKKIIEVCKVILEGRNFEYIQDETCYVTYILVCQLLEQLHWIDWGTSIRGAWFEESHFGYVQAQPILKYAYSDVDDRIPFTIDNLKALINFMEE